MLPTTYPPESAVAARSTRQQGPASDSTDPQPANWVLDTFTHARDVLTQTDCGPAISMAITKAQLLLEADNASICLVDAGGSAVQHLLTAALSTATPFDEPADDWLPYQQFNECAAFQRHRACTGCRLLPDVEWCASAPLSAGDQQIGMLCAMRKTEQPPFGAQQLRLLESLASWTSVALGNARKLATQREAQRSEREQIAAHLHDNVAQSLSIIGLKVNQIETRLGSSLPPEAIEQLRAVKSVSQQLMSQVRAAFGELRQPQQSPGDIVSALAGCVELFTQSSPLPIQFFVSGDCVLPEFITAQAVQIVNEALRNVSRHADANTVQVTLMREAQSVRIVVEDDGIGFDPKNVYAGQLHLGAILMRERAQRSGGLLAINSRPGDGTQVVLTYPAVLGT